jgi:ArsR family transcriptional regulator
MQRKTRTRRALGRPLRDHSRLLTEDIIHAARQEFLREGYERATMDRIAAMLHISKRTLYARFANKSLLFERVVEMFLREHFASLGAIERSGLSLREELMAVGRAIVKVVTQPDTVELYRIISAEAVTFPKLARQIRDQGSAPLIELIAEILARAHKGSPSPSLPREAETFLHLIALAPMRLAILGVPSVSGMDSEEMLQRSVDLFVKGFYAPEIGELRPPQQAAMKIFDAACSMTSAKREQIKALDNDIRLSILAWLRDPAGIFPPQEHGKPEIGICVTHIQQKAGLSLATVSTHLSILRRAGFVKMTRIGKWTYYRRDEDTIGAFIEGLAKAL